MKKNFLNLDNMGVCASSLCAAHCLLFPLFVAAVPFLTSGPARTQASQAETAAAAGTPSAEMASVVECSQDSCCAVPIEPTIAHNATTTAACCDSPSGFWIHAGFLGIAFPLGLFTWLRGLKRHKRTVIPVLGACGLAVLCLALYLGVDGLGMNGERIMTLCGSALLVSAHLWNRHQCRCCGAGKATASTNTLNAAACPVA